MTPNRQALLSATLCFASLAGCKKEITVYRAAKARPTAQNPAAPGPTAQGASGLRWDPPKSWEELPASGMRLATFALKGRSRKQADVSVVMLPGDAGGLLSNINRWRSQIGLPPLDEASLPRRSEHVQSAAGKGILVDFLSAQTLNGAGQKTRVIAAIVSADGNSWFFKMTGQDAVIAAAKPDFKRFLKSLRPP